MKRFFQIGWAAWTVALVTAGGCTTLLGVNQDYHGVVDGGAGGEQTTNSSASSASATGTGGAADSSAASSASASSASGSSGSGGDGACAIVHAGGKGTCEYLPGKECGCSAPGEKCSVPDANQATGASACVVAGATPQKTWDTCDTDSDCGPGVWCDHLRHVCKPICATTDQCPTGAHCVPVPVDGAATTIPGLKTCTAHCDPTSANPCGAGATCFYDGTASEFDCVRSAKIVAGAACKFADDCGKGLACLGSGGAMTCERWCSPANNLFSSPCALADPNKSYCDAFGIMATYNGVIYGACAP